MFHLLSDPAFNLLLVATLQCNYNQLRTLLCAFLPAEFVASVPTVQLFLARFLTRKLTVWSEVWHHLHVVTLRNSFLHYHHAWSTGLITWQWTAVPICTKHPLTRLQTRILFVLYVIWVTCPCANMSTTQPKFTGTTTASFWYLAEVCCSRYQCLSFRMVLTVKHQWVVNVTFLPKGMKDLATERNLPKHSHTSNAIQPFLSSG